MKKNSLMALIAALVLAVTCVAACSAEQTIKYNIDGTVEVKDKRFGGHLQVDYGMVPRYWNFDGGLFLKLKPDFTVGASLALPALTIDALKTEKVFTLWGEYTLIKGLTVKLSNIVNNIDFANSSYMLTTRYSF